MVKNWCEACSERCDDHPTMCTICGEELQEEPPSSSSFMPTGSNSNGSVTRSNTNTNANANALAGTDPSTMLSILRNSQMSPNQAASVASALASLTSPNNNTTATDNNVNNINNSMNEIWEEPSAEAMDPTNQQAKSRPTSREFLDRIPRIRVDQYSAILHQATVSCVPPPDDRDGVMKRTGIITGVDAVVGEFPPSPPFRITGRIILSSPLVGVKTDPSLAFTSTSTSSLQWAKGCIVYMERGGGLTFVQKALYAQNAGAIGVICGNNASIWPYVMKDSTNEATRGSAGNTLKIPMVMIKKSDGIQIKSLLERYRGGKPSGTESASQSSTPGLVRATIVAERVSADRGGDCVVCADTFQIGDTVLRLPFCAHVFHRKCAVPWLEKHNTCPFCRRELPTDDLEYERERRRVQRTHAGASTAADDEGGLHESQWEGIFG